jgi:LAO/AO transport system kinase
VSSVAVPGIDTAMLRAGDRRTLSRAITLVESLRDDHRAAAQALLEEILPATGDSLRIGVSGVPGVGKSTFIEAFGLHLLEKGRRVAVLAVDPSSPRGGGSILGDKTRMERLACAQGAFIRPSPAAGTLGGVALRTRESMLLCEAAGYDTVIIETVGVGQSEFEVAGMVDFFLVLLLPNAGDELQGVKRGIVELADALVVNKADGPTAAQAENARTQYESALTMLRREPGASSRVLTCSALEGRNVDAVWQMIEAFHGESAAAGRVADRRAAQNAAWMERLVREMIEQMLARDPQLSGLLPELRSAVAAGTLSPLTAARQIVEKL